MAWKVKSKSTSVSAEYSDEKLRVDVSYEMDSTTQQVKTVNGSIYGPDATYLGNFHRNADEKYSFSGVSLEHLAAVTKALEEIELNLVAD